ncbi:MAG: hypothetical protein KAS32_00070 [Candidatus Peribacteraceae bacterium]|nr:hypothetical protein [Candidatus Peribacteraceae bacterium]
MKALDKKTLEWLRVWDRLNEMTDEEKSNLLKQLSDIESENSESHKESHNQNRNIRKFRYEKRREVEKARREKKRLAGIKQKKDEQEQQKNS